MIAPGMTLHDLSCELESLDAGLHVERGVTWCVGVVARSGAPRQAIASGATLAEAVCAALDAFRAETEAP